MVRRDGLDPSFAVGEISFQKDVEGRRFIRQTCTNLGPVRYVLLGKCFALPQSIWKEFGWTSKCIRPRRQLLAERALYEWNINNRLLPTQDGSAHCVRSGMQVSDSSRYCFTDNVLPFLLAFIMQYAKPVPVFL